MALFAASFGAAVVAVEPTTRAFLELLRQLAAQPESARRHCFAVRAALGDGLEGEVQRVTDAGSGVDVLCRAGQHGGRSERVSCRRAEAGESTGTAEVALMTVEELLRRISVLKDTVLVKIDVEGYEFVLVRALGRFLMTMQASALVALHPSYLAGTDNQKLGKRRIQLILQNLMSIFPFVYTISHDRKNFRVQPRLVQRSSPDILCDFWDGCQVFCLWAPLDHRRWNSSAC